MKRSAPPLHLSYLTLSYNTHITMLTYSRTYLLGLSAVFPKAYNPRSPYRLIYMKSLPPAAPVPYSSATPGGIPASSRAGWQ